jgi:hypothetical protein
MSKPTITEREVSRRQAEAGIHARVAAQTLGGDPAQVRALLSAASGESPEIRETPESIGGISFHGLDLATSLANTALAAHPAAKKAVPPALQVARLVLVFADPLEAYDLLTNDSPDALREFDRTALDMVARWTKTEIEAFADYLATLKPAEETPVLGKSKRRTPPGRRTR